MKSQITVYYQKAVTLALEEVERKARAILKKQPHLREFMMGMGEAFFIDQNDDIVDEKPYMKPVFKVIAEWDQYLKLTGEAMRFTADGPIVTNW